MMRAVRFIFLMLVAVVACSPVKYTDSYGFLPGNDALANSEALQKCLDGGGRIRVRKAGIYPVCRTLVLDAGTDLSFKEGVVLSKELGPDGSGARFTFINRGAFTREYDEGIRVRGLHLQCNGLDSRSGGELDIPGIVGLSCQVAFFYVKDLYIDRFTLLDLPPHDFAIQICTFENVTVENVHVEGMKDAVHFGPGRGFVVRHGIFKTYDDPIALNAHDYTTSNPELGWIEDGLIEDCTDLDDPENGTTGFFARILAGGWRDWEAGMKIQSSGDAVVCDGRIYRSNGPKVRTEYESAFRPSHTEGTVTYPDGITWTMSQDRNICRSCGVRNVVFRDISTPVDSIILRDSRIGSSEIRLLKAIDAPGMEYDTTLVRLERVECANPDSLVRSPGRPFKVMLR